MAYISKWHGEQIDEGVGKALDLDIGEIITRTEYEGDIGPINTEISSIREDIDGLQQTVNDEIGSINSKIDGGFENLNLYLGPNGNDDNTGLDSNNRMKTIAAALEKYKDRYSLRFNLAAGEYSVGSLTIENKRIAIAGASRDNTFINGVLTFNSCTLSASNVTFTGNTSNRTVTLQYSLSSFYRANFINEGSGEALLCLYATNVYLDGSTITSTGTNAVRSSGAATVGLGYCTITGNVIVSTGGEVKVIGGSRTGVTKESGGVIFVDGVMQ